ncbi:hypothetical protein SKAU_G00023600, partial [Synaphobranchus kaupii]
KISPEARRGPAPSCGRTTPTPRPWRWLSAAGLAAPSPSGGTLTRGPAGSSERARRKRTTRSLSYTESTKYHPAKRQAKVEPCEEEGKLVLDSNPLQWTVADVVRFIRSTDCAPLAKIFQEQDIDGQALLLLTLPTVQECMDLKLGPAIKLCHQIERVKVAFYAQYAN